MLRGAFCAALIRSEGGSTFALAGAAATVIY